jgi:tellurite resistance protein TehA-like permease
MGMDNWNLGIPMMLVTVCTIGLGGLFALIAWRDVVYDRRRTTHWKASTALHTFSASVYLPLIGYVFLAVTSPSLQERYIQGIPLAAVLYLGVLAASFILVIISLLFVQRDSGSVRGVVLTGSRILFVVDALGSIGIVMGLRVMLLR